MAPWQYAGSVFQRFTGSGWTNTPVTVAAGTTIRFRGMFTIANGDEPISTGDLTTERRIDGGAWQDWGSTIKDVEPGFDQNVPQIVEFLRTFGSEWAGSLVEVRLRVDWPGGPYHDANEEIDVTVEGVPAVVTGPRSMVYGRSTESAAAAGATAAIVSGAAHDGVCETETAGTVRGVQRGATIGRGVLASLAAGRSTSGVANGGEAASSVYGRARSAGAQADPAAASVHGQTRAATVYALP